MTKEIKKDDRAMIMVDTDGFVIKIEGVATYPASLDFGGNNGSYSALLNVEAGDLLADAAIRYLTRYELVAVVAAETETFTGLGNTAR